MPPLCVSSLTFCCVSRPDPPEKPRGSWPSISYDFLPESDSSLGKTGWIPRFCVIFPVCMLQCVHTLKKTRLLQSSLTLPHNCYSCAAPLVWPDLKLLFLQLTVSTFCLQPIIPITLNAKTAGYSSCVGQGFRLSEWSINDEKCEEVKDAEEFNKWLNQICRPPSCFRAQSSIPGGALGAEGLPLNASMSEHCTPSLPLCILITSGHLSFLYLH